MTEIYSNQTVRTGFCGICKHKESVILGDLWMKSPKCGNHCKTWIKRFYQLIERRNG